APGLLSRRQHGVRPVATPRRLRGGPVLSGRVRSRRWPTAYALRDAGSLDWRLFAVERRPDDLLYRLSGRTRAPIRDPRRRGPADAGGGRRIDHLSAAGG